MRRCPATARSALLGVAGAVAVAVHPATALADGPTGPVYDGPGGVKVSFGPVVLKNASYLTTAVSCLASPDGVCVIGPSILQATPRLGARRYVEGPRSIPFPRITSKPYQCAQPFPGIKRTDWRDCLRVPVGETRTGHLAIPLDGEAYDPVRNEYERWRKRKYGFFAGVVCPLRTYASCPDNARLLARVEVDARAAERSQPEYMRVRRVRVLPTGLAVTLECRRHVRATCIFSGAVTPRPGFRRDLGVSGGGVILDERRTSALERGRTRTFVVRFGDARATRVGRLVWERARTAAVSLLVCDSGRTACRAHTYGRRGPDYYIPELQQDLRISARPG